MIPRAVFDCMVFVQALANDRGPAFGCFQLAQIGRLDLCVSAAILAEIRDVLDRPKLRSKLPALTPDRASAFLSDVLTYATLITDVPHLFRYGRDPKDEPYIHLAIAGGARYLVSRDKDILDLVQDHDFRTQYPHLSILDPVALLREFIPAAGLGEP